MKQSALARVIGKSQVAVSRRLSGEIPFSVDELVAIAALLELDVAVLLDAEPAEVAS